MRKGLTVKEQAALYLTLDLFKSNFKRFPLKLFQPDQFDAEVTNEKHPVLITEIIKSLLTAFNHPSRKSCDQYWVFLLKRLIDNNLEEFELNVNPLDVKSSQVFSDSDNPFYDLKFPKWIKIFQKTVDLAVSENMEIKKEIDRRIKSGRSSMVQLKPVGNDSVKNLKYWHAGSARVYSQVLYDLTQDKDDNWAVATSTVEDLEDLAASSTPYLKGYFTRQVAEIRAHVLFCEKQEREEQHRLYLLEQQRLEKIRLEEDERLAQLELERERKEKQEKRRLEKEALLAKFKNRPKRGAKINYFLPEEEESDHESDLIYYDNNQENDEPNETTLTEKLADKPPSDLMVALEDD